ncbi:MAG: desulfoferrodoxin [Methanobrevibacter sp.]|nr:desulfoferrodoxin [Methanobrevibacter sp.]
MAKINEIYRCNQCGNMVEGIVEGMGTLVCCGEEMELLEPRQLEEGGVKHIPIVTKEDGKIVVTMGEVPHPMEEEHFINFVQLTIGDQVFRANLKPGEEPKAVFDINAEIEDIKAIEYCNIHGLWHA